MNSINDADILSAVIINIWTEFEWMGTGLLCPKGAHVLTILKLKPSKAQPLVTVKH